MYRGKKVTWAMAIDTVLKRVLPIILIVGFAIYIVSYKHITEAQEVIGENHYLFSTQNNDIAIYVPKAYTNRYQYYDAGKGHDTIWIKMTLKDFYDPVFQADLIRFYYFLLLYTNQTSIADTGPSFHFKKFNLRVRNFESLVIEEIDDTTTQTSEKPLENILPIYDTRIDSLS